MSSVKESRKDSSLRKRKRHDISSVADANGDVRKKAKCLVSSFVFDCKLPVVVHV